MIDKYAITNYRLTAYAITFLYFKGEVSK